MYSQTIPQKRTHISEYHESLPCKLNVKIVLEKKILILTIIVIHVLRTYKIHGLYLFT